jgi:PAS domain S-box-containing protein
MDPSEIANTVEQNRRLRRTMRDLVALSTLPAVWVGLGTDGVVRSLCDALLNTLSLDLVYARVAPGSGDGVLEVARSAHYPKEVPVERISLELAPLLSSDQVDRPTTIPDPFGTSVLRLAVTRFGVSDDSGVLVAGSHRADFPTEQERLLLGVAANQTAIIVQRRRVEEQLRDQQEWLHVTLASIGDAVIATDTQGRVTFLNAVAEKLTGWSQQDAKGKPLELVFTILNEQSHQPVANPVEKVLRSGAIVGLANHTILIAKDGTERPIDDSAAPICDADGVLLGVVLTFRDVTEQRRSDQLRNIRLSVTNALSNASTVKIGAGEVLRAICEQLGWEIGCFWVAAREADALTCLVSWRRLDVAAEEFLNDCCSRIFKPGEGLPGRVLATRKPDWIPDIREDNNFPRLRSAAKYDLHSAFAFPVSVGGHTLGVIEFFTKRIREPDPNLLEMMGTVAGALGQFIERKEAEQELQRSEWELADFFNNATTPLHWVGPDGTILRANQAELDLLGYNREEYIGRSITEFHADNEAICEILNRLKAGEKLAEYPARLRCKNGAVKDVLIDSNVLWNEDRFVHTRCFTRDITERKRAENALADARSRLNAALQAGAIFTWTWDIETNRLFADESLARLFNLNPTDADGELLDKYIKSIHPDDWPRVQAALELSAKTGAEYEADYRIIQPDGSVRWVTARGRPERDDTGRPIRMPGVLVDITDRKRLENELREADRRKDEFLATLAHELRNPLAPIRNGLNLLRMSDENGAEVAHVHEMMDRQVSHMVRLVDDLLELSRISRGQIELKKDRVPLATVINQAVETSRPFIESGSHRLDLSLPEEELLIEGDVVRLSQVFANLLNNAAKYTNKGGQILLVVQKAGKDIIVSVQDNGIGIPPDKLSRVFEMFAQINNPLRRTQEGLGIGLNLVRTLVLMHGGTVEARSEGLGKGSEFRVRLPLAQVGSSQASEAPTSLNGNVETREIRRILCVDDNKDSADSLGMMLRFLGADVHTAYDGASALEAIKICRPSIVLMDLGMPGMDGCEVARRIRQDPEFQNVLLIAMTGWGQEEDRRRSSEAGFDHHLVKPVDIKALKGLLASAG